MPSIKATSSVAGASSNTIYSALSNANILFNVSSSIYKHYILATLSMPSFIQSFNAHDMQIYLPGRDSINSLRTSTVVYVPRQIKREGRGT